MSKKRKLNSQNPKYWDKSLLNEKPIAKKIHACTTPNKVKVYTVWYDDDGKCDEVDNDRNDEWQLNHESNGYV